MDWFSWLSKTTLDPSLVGEYASLFVQNELEESDITHFNHELLQSMGISIAKHRLLILKLARKHHHRHHHRAISRFLLPLSHTKRSLARCVRALLHWEDRALVVVPAADPARSCRYSSMWKRTAVMSGKNRKLMMLTDGSDHSLVASAKKAETPKRSSSPVAVEEIRWDAMFQDLKPT